MTPRQADLAYVLEGVPGVLEVCGLDTAGAPAGDLELAVKVAHGTGTLAAAHYALLRVLTHEECRTVLFHELELPAALRGRATRLALSTAEREDARARVPVTSAALQQEMVAGSWPGGRVVREDYRVLVVDGDEQVLRALTAAIGATAQRVVEPNPTIAVARARDEHFDVVLCDARLAFGRQGFLQRLLVADRYKARRVVLLAHDEERALLLTSLDELHYWGSFLSKPLDPKALREVLHVGGVVQRWSIPVLPARGAIAVAARAVAARSVATVRQVLVADDDPTSAMLLASMGGGDVHATVTSDEWEALDLLDAPDLALVVCSISLRTQGGTPFYRLLWNARPDIKRRFVFISHAGAAPASSPEGRAAPVIERPLTRDAIVALVERFSPPGPSA